MEHVDDPRDPRLEVFRLTREPHLLREQDTFIAESRSVVRRLLEHPRARVESVLTTESALTTIAPGLAAHPGVKVYVAPKGLLQQVTGYHVHRGCLAAARRLPGLTFDALTRLSSRIWIGLEAVSNPDNVGGIFRSALAFGAGAVLVDPACGDPLYRKSIRTSVGATLTVPFCRLEDLHTTWPALLDTLPSLGVRRVALTLDPKSVPLSDVTPSDRSTLLLVGNEGAGLSAEVMARVDVSVRIPMAPGIDSLNAGVAASIALYHFYQASMEI